MSLLKRRQTKNQMVTLEDLLREIKHEFKKRLQVLLLLPKKAICDAIGMNLLETRLEDAGQPQLAQVVRWLCFQNLSWRFRVSNRIWCYLKMGEENMLRKTVQLSAYTKEELQALQTSLELLETNAISKAEEAIAKRSQVDRYKKEFQQVERSYQEYVDILWGVDEAIPVGVLGRAFRAFRKDPNWYLNSQMCQACARWGGCCGWACRCCEKDREASFRDGKRGHCSGFCGCCLRTHGKQYKSIEAEGMRKFEPLGIKISIRLSVCTGSFYRDRESRAYLWGVGFIDELGLL